MRLIFLMTATTLKELARPSIFDSLRTFRVATCWSIELSLQIYTTVTVILSVN
jgi:hypothetical protein